MSYRKNNKAILSFTKKDYFIKEDWFSLGHLLNEKDEIILDLFGEDQTKVLAYYLINGNNGKAGFNLRNNYAHYKNITSKEISWENTVLVLHIFINILNEIKLKITRS